MEGGNYTLSASPTIEQHWATIPIALQTKKKKMLLKKTRKVYTLINLIQRLTQTVKYTVFKRGSSHKEGPMAFYNLLCS